MHVLHHRHSPIGHGLSRFVVDYLVHDASALSDTHAALHAPATASPSTRGSSWKPVRLRKEHKLPPSVMADPPVMETNMRGGQPLKGGVSH